MAKHRINAKARCPYYKHEDTPIVYCEGHSKLITHHIAFASCTAAKRYKEYYCYARYQECTAYKMLSVDDPKIKRVIGDKDD